MLAMAIVTSLETMAAGALGPTARLAPVERGMIQPSLGRMLARMDASQLAKYSTIMDPLMVGLGLSLYGFRVWSTVAARQAAADRSEASRGTAQPTAERRQEGEQSAAAPPPETTPNGHDPTGFAPVPIAIVASMESTDLEGYR